MLFIFLNKQNYFNQFGLRKGCSTDLALVSLFNKVSESLNRLPVTGTIFCDLSKAFDCVRYKIVIEMAILVINCNNLVWITSYLSERKQKTIVKNIDGVFYFILVICKKIQFLGDQCPYQGKYFYWYSKWKKLLLLTADYWVT